MGQVSFRGAYVEAYAEPRSKSEVETQLAIATFQSWHQGTQGARKARYKEGKAGVERALRILSRDVASNGRGGGRRGIHRGPAQAARASHNQP